MVCIYCRADTQVVNSRPQKRSNTVWRRRKCRVCSNIFSTEESADYSLSVVVRSQSHNNDLIPFDKQRLFISVYDACRHRTDPIGDATALTITAINHLFGKRPSAAVLERDEIVRTTLVILKRFDRAAAVQYEAFHPLKRLRS